MDSEANYEMLGDDSVRRCELFSGICKLVSYKTGLGILTISFVLQ